MVYRHYNRADVKVDAVKFYGYFACCPFSDLPSWLLGLIADSVLTASNQKLFALTEKGKIEEVLPNYYIVKGKDSNYVHLMNEKEFTSNFVKL